MQGRRWLIPALAGAAVVVAGGGVILSRRTAVAPPPAPVPQKIGLAAVRDGDGLRVEWNRNAAAVRQSTHALLYIQDGKAQSQLSLTAEDLASSQVRYWPESDQVRVRLELFDGKQGSSDEVRVAAEPVEPTARAAVERARPSPFQHSRPHAARRAAAPSPPQPPLHAADRNLDVNEPRKKSGWISHIPLVRRLKKHPKPIDIY